jgi:hypothetical protein
MCSHPRAQTLTPREFQIKRGAAWLVSWCPSCNYMSFFARNPHKNEPMVDQVEVAA